MNLKTAVDLGGRRQALEAIKVATASHFTNLMTTAVSVTACRHKTWAETEASTAVFRMNHRFVNLQKIATRFRFGWITPALMLLSLAGGLQAQQITLVTTTIPGGTVGFPYSTQLVKSGGTGIGTSYAITAGALPAGVTLNASTGLISGTPTAAGTFTPTLQVTDTSTTIDSKNYSIVVRASGILNARWQGTQGTTQTYTGGAVIGAGGDQWNSFFVGTGSSTNLLDNAGVATPIGVAWTSDIAWHNLDRNGFCTPSPNGFCPLMNGYLAKNSGVVANVNFSGLPANSSWDMLLYQQIDSGGSRRISVTINGTTTALTTTDNSGTDSTFIQGKNYLVVTANTDGSGNFNVAYRGVGPDPEGDINGIQLRPHVSGASITQTVAPSGPVSTAYNLALAATGGSGTGRVWTVASGSLPPGLTLNASTGVLSGTPTATGTYNFTVLMVDSAANTATQAFTLNIQQATSTALSATLTSPSTLGSPFSMTATVTPSNAAGKVAFYDGNVILGFKTLVSGSATLSYPFLASSPASGPHKLKAVYLGDSLSITSASTVRNQIVASKPQNGFATAVSSATGTNPWGVTTGDFNNDGIPDAVVTNYGSVPGFVGGGTTVSTFLGTGNPAAPFGAQTTTAVATGPISVAAGDFNEDGNMDLAVAGYSTNTVSILLGNGSGGFTPSNFTAGVGTSPTSFALADFNGDGHVDMAIANNGSGNMSVLFGSGTGTFTASATYTTGPNPSEVVAADLNGDLIADLLITNNSNFVTVLLGQAAGLFGTATNYASGGTGPGSLALGDFNSDGFLDVAAGHISSNNIGILLGTGTGAFGTATMFAGGSETRFVKTGDFNGDGVLDLVVNNNTASNILILTGNGNGTFATGVAYNVASGTSGSMTSAVADLNGDGVTDIIAVNNGSSTISTFMGTAVTTTTLTSSVNPSNFQQNVTLTATVSPSTATGTVTFKDGATTIGSGTLSAGIASMSISNLTSGAHSLTAVYGGNTTNLTSTSSVLTQNVRTAVVVSTTTLPNGQISTVYSQTLAATGGVSPYAWSLNSGALPSGVTLSAGGVLSGTPTVTGTFNVNVLAADSVNGVGAQALSLVVNAAPLSSVTTLSVAGCSGSCVANVSQAVSLQAAVTQGGNSVGTLGSVAFFSNTKILGVAPVSSGTATLATTTIPGGTTSLRAIYLANGTYASSKSSAVSIAVSARGGNGFATATSYSSGGTTPSLIALADVTGDSIADMVVAHSGGTPSSVGVLKGNGSGGFAAVQNFTVGTDANSIGVGDFNSDGKLDIAVTNGSSSNFSILLNTSPNVSTLSFATAVNYAAGLNPQTIAVADFNGDGIADLALTNFIAPVTVNLYFGVGNGTFPASPSLTLTGPDSYATALEAGDLNGDGNADLAVATGGNLVVFLNTGSGAFTSALTFASAAITNPVSLAIADYNSDGKADVALTNYQPSPNGTVVVLLNNSGEVFSFGAGTTYTIGANPWGLAAGDFTGDGNLDLAAVNLADDNVNLLLGSAAGTFTVAGTVAVGSFPKGIAVGDVNADGVLDFVTANSGSGVSVLLGVGTTTTSLTSSVNPTNFGQSTALTATVSPSTATGTVTFKDGATTIGSATLSSGTATLSISSLTSGSHSLTAEYGGNTTNGTSTSGVVSQTVRTAVVISTTTLIPARQNSAYSISLGVSGGTGPYTLAVSAGALPAGLTLSSEGFLSGIPTVNGSFSFSATATDSLGGAGVQSLSLIVNTVNSVFNGHEVQVVWYYPDLSTLYQPLQSAKVGAGVEFSKYALANPTFDIDFSDTTIQINSGRDGSQFDPTQPFNGLVITHSGSVPNFSNVTITATNWTDGSVLFDSSRITFDATHIYLNFKGMLNQIGMGLTLQVNGIGLPTTIPGSSVGFPYSSQLTTTGGTGTGRVYALASGTLPTGLTLNTSTGVISGVPTTAGTFTPTLQVTDSGSNTTSRAYSVVIRQAGLLNTRWQGSPSTVYTGPGFIGNGSDTWNLFETGSGSGTLLDNAGQATPVAITWTADGALSPQPFDSNAFCYPSPTSFCSLMGNYLYKSGGTAGNVTFSNLPANASWDIYLYQQRSVSNGGRQISITANGVTAVTTIPNDPNDSTFLLNKNYLLTTASTNGSGQLSINFQGTAGDLEANINGLQLRPHLDPLTITQTTIPAGTVGATYSTTLTLTGGTGVGNVFVVSSEVGPGNLTLSSGGVLSGTPSTAGSFPFTVRVTDSQGNIANRALTLVVNPPVSITTTSLPTGVLGAAYNFTLAAAGGSGSYTWSITSGALHGGLSLNAATGAITGTPIQTGNPSVVFRATDTNGQFAAVQFTLTVNPAVSVTTSTLPGGAVGTAYSQTLAATGGLGGYTWSITSGALQAGLSLNSATGAITGTPTVSGPANITFRATDTGSNFGAATIALTIAGTTTTSLSTSLGSPSPFSANQSLTATVSPLSTGRVTFYDGASVVGIATLSSGTATISGKLLGTGTHSLRAYFLGSAEGLPSLSSSVVQVVNSKPQSGFAAGVGYAAGTGPSLGTSADFNGDGNADYAVANYGASNISVFLGNGLGALGAATNFTVGTNPFSLTTGDFNGDGKVDIATANLFADSISILPGDGAGSFTAPVTQTAGVGLHPGQIIAADFNRDGLVDLATANYNSNNVSVLLGSGTGTFGTGVLYAAGTNPASLAAGDFNNDGIADLAVGNQATNNVSILLGQAGGVFAAATNYPAGGTTLQGVTTADFNADGNLDLVVTNSGTNTVTLLAGTGSGTFGTASVIGASSGANFTVAGDFNGNGVPDVAVTNDTGSNVSVLIGSGSLTFASPVNYALAPGASGAKGITVTDLNGDGVSDLVVASSTSNSISVLLGVATTTTTLTSSVNPSNLAAATTLTATVSPSTAAGTVTFKDGAATLGTGTLSGGVATFAASFATAGVHSLTAVYAGNGTNTASTSSALTQNVNQGATTTSLSSQTNPGTFAATATFTATVAPSTATGTVTFRLGGLTLGTGTLSGGTASFSTTTLAAGAYSIDAIYGGDSNYVTSTSTALTQTVNARTTTTGLSTSPNPSTSGQNVTLTATVTPSSATGSVTFKNGAATLGIGTLSSGVATFGTTSLAVGGHSLTAVYDGDGNNATSTSSAVNQIVNAPLVITTSSLPNAVQNAAYNQTLTVTGGSGAKTWSLPEGSVLPVGLSLGSTGAITGTPTVAGAYTFTVGVTDSLGATQNTTLGLLVNTPLSIITNTLSVGTVKFPYYGEIFASGGSGSGYTFDVSAGTLPPGLSLNATTGVVSGSPSTAGGFNFTARVTDSSAATATQALTITIDGYGVLSIQFQDPSDSPHFGPAVIGNPVDLWNVFKSPTGTQPILYDEAGNLISVGLTFSGASVATTGTTSGFCSPAVTPYCDLMKSHLRVEAGNTGAISLKGFNPGSTWSLYLYSQSNLAGRTLSVAVNGGAPVVTSTGNPADAAFILNKNYLVIPATADGTGEINLAFTSANGLEAVLNGLQVTPQVPTLTITTSSLPSGVAGSVYSQTLAGTGGTTLLYDWTISAGALPSGLTLNPTTGVISGTPSVAGTFNLTVTLEDALSYTASRALTLQVNPALSSTTSTLPSGVQNVGYSQTLVAAGGAGSNVWSLQSGTLPAGLTLSAGGVISGTPTATGSSTFTVRVTDASTAFVNQTLTLQVALPLNITTSLLNQGEVGLAYTQTLSATGGVPGYTWTITSGALQSGLTLNPATGVISGTPLVAGTANLVFRATDSVGNIASTAGLPLTISPALAITTSSLPTGIVSVAYSQALALSGGLGPHTWTISSGSIPGLSLATNGTLSGTPQTAGTFTITARVVDALNVAVTQSLNLTVANVLSISTAVVPGGSVGIPYSQPIATVGGSGSGHTFLITAGAMPNGLTIAQTTGLIAGTPTTAGTFNFTVSVTDSASLTATLAYTTTISAFGTVNLQFQGSPATSYNGAGVIGTSGDSWNLFTLAPDSRLVNESHGHLTGIVANMSGDNIANGLLQGGFCAPSPNAFCNLMNGYLFKSAGQTGNVTFSGLAPNSNWDLFVYTQPNQGAGRSLSLSVNGGATVTSTPNTAGDSTFILNKNYVRLSAQANGSGLLSLNYNGASGDQEANINAIQLRPFQTPLTITQTNAPDAVAGVPYTLALTATGGTGTGRVWSISTGALPGGLTLNSSTGVIGGAPSVSGAVNFIAQVVDSQNNTGTQSFTLLINPPLTFTNTSLLSGVINVPYTETLAAAGGFGGYVWSIQTGTLPTGLTLAPSTGIISGTPTASGSSTVTFTVTDSSSQVVSRSLTIVINGTVSVTTSTLPNAISGVAYSTTLAASGGLSGYTWSVTSGTLPSGLTLNPAAGVISGTAASATTANITVRAADTGNNFATASLSLQVLAPVTITTLTLPEGVRNFAYSQNGLNIVATGATNAYTFDVSAGTLPAGLTLSPAGLLAGTPSVAGTFTFTVRVTDASTSQATQQYTLVINASLIVSTVTMPPATQGTPYSQALTATGGVAPLTWAILPTSTASQAGFTINSATGLLTGTPNTFGKLYIDIQLQDFAGNGTTRSLELIIARNGTSNTDFAVSGSSKIVRMSATGTNILTVCTGVNCHAGDIAADAQGNIYSHDTTGIYKITPGGVVTTLLARPGGGVGGLAVDGSGNIIFVDNRSDEIYRVTPAGVLTIVAAFPDASTLELQDAFVAVDSGGNYIVGSDAGSTMRIYRFTPAGAVTTLATWAGKGVTGLAISSDGKIAFGDYRNIQLAVFDPAGSPNNVVTYNIPQGEGTLPRGLAIDPANGHYIVPEQYSNTLSRITPGGAITEMFQGTPLAAPTSIAAIPALAAPVISTLSLPSGLVGQNYGSFQVVATGGTGNFTWTATGLPAGLTMSTGGIISGGSSAAGTFQINITVTDVLLGLTAAKLLPLTIASPIAPVTLSSSSSQANIALGGTVSASFAAGGGVPPYTFSASGLPQGVSLNGTGSLSGSPASPGNSTATIFVSDASGRSASTSFSITVLGILISSLPNGTTGIPYSATIGALGGVQPYSFSANGLPNGLGLSAQGTIAGTPTVGGNFNVTVTVSDGAGARISAGGTITIVVPGAPVSIPSGSLPDATVGVPYSASLSAIGGKTPYSWSVLSGSLPDGLSFGANGIVSGTPTAPGGGGFAALVTDSSGGTASTGASITVKPAPIVITSKSPLASGMLGVEYPSVQLAATGGIAPYKWAVSGGAFPAGVALDSGGTISGTPTTAGDFTATVTVTDAAGTTGSSGFSVTMRQISADLILSSATAAFELTTGAVTLPSGLAIGVQSTVVAQQISFAVVTSPSVSWLTVTNGNKTPDSISVVLSNGALSLPAGDYSTTLKVTCSTGSCSGSAQSVAVTLKVTSPPARLRVVTDILSFTTTSQNLAPISQTIAIQNAGGGSLGVASVSCGAPWCTVGAPPAALAGGSSANIPITVNPGAVSAGYYRTTVEISTSGGKGSVPVTLFIAQNSSMTLSPSGGQFGMPQGGAPGNPSGSFLVSVNSTSAVTFTASQLPGADWLKVGTSSVSASSAQPGTISYSIDTAAAGRLTPGTYYGQISVGGTGIVNAPQTHQVILNVTPPTDVARPDPQPAGLLFLTTLGGTNPPPQIVTVFTSSTRAVQFQASATSDGGWLSVSPGLGTTSQPAPAGTNATVNIAGLKQGVYTGLISYAFAGNAVRSVNVTLVVSPVGGTAATLTSSTGTPSVSAPLQPRATCTATSLAAVQTGIVSNFSAPAAWPTPLSLRIVDDCGGTVTGAQIVSTFSNGDPPLPLPLVDSKNGVYAGTWTPRKQSATLTISARVTAKGYKDLSMQLIGAVTPNAAPLLTPNGTVHAFSPLVGAPLAPGNIVAVYGSNLAVLTGVPAAVPLPTAVNGTQVLIGGIKAPLYFTSPGQVNAQIPYELEPNKQYQVIISANGALSTPDAIQLTNVVPGLAAYADGTVIAQHADGSLITAKSPAKGGETAIAYLSGLGATDNNPASGGAAPGDILARPNSLPTLSIGGKDAKIAFVGLTPGLVGLYQMNFEVPEGLDAGNPRITVTQEGSSSTPVLLPYVPK